MFRRVHRPHPYKAKKISGFVETVEPDGSWWARLKIDGREYAAEMYPSSWPSDIEIQTGMYFTMPARRDWKPPVYVPRTSWSRSKLKRVHKEAKAWAEKMMMWIEEAKAIQSQEPSSPDPSSDHQTVD